MYENRGWKYLGILTVLAFLGFSLVYRPLVQGKDALALGVDLQGGSEITYRLDAAGSGVDVNTDLVETTISVLRERLDALAIKEMVIRPEGTDRFVIQLPGAVQEQMEEVKRMVEKTGRLDFKIVVTPDSPNYRMSQEEIARQINEITRQKAAGTYDPRTQVFDTGVYEDTKWNDNIRDWEILSTRTLLLRNDQQVSGDGLTNAYRTVDSYGAAAVGFEFGAEGASKFRALTGKNVRERMAIVLDGKVRSYPVIRSEIGSKGIIELGAIGDAAAGGVTPGAHQAREEEVKQLIVVLKAGRLPAKPVFQGMQTVGASLGKDAIDTSKYAIGLSFLIVVFFMLFYYRASGLVADLTLIANLIMILGVLALGEATLTLPGIAGIVLTAGMAVDANILVNERIREEREKGMALRQAVQNGYDRAFWTIVDANVTTLITALILFKVGTGPVKGFAVTLSIGVLSTLLSVLFIGKTVTATLVDRGLLKDLKMLRILSKPAIDFASLRFKWVAVSLVVFNLGYVIFHGRGAEKYGIDFTGGNIVQMKLTEPMEKADVKTKIDEALDKKDERHAEINVQTVDPLDEGQDRAYEFKVSTQETGERLEKKAAREIPGAGSEGKAEEPAKQPIKLPGLDPGEEKKQPDSGGGAGGAGGQDPAPAPAPPAGEPSGDGDGEAAPPAAGGGEGGEAAPPEEGEGGEPAPAPTPEGEGEGEGPDILDRTASPTKPEAEPEQQTATTAGQDLIHRTIKETFADRLVKTYPVVEGAKEGREFAVVTADDSTEAELRVHVRFRITFEPNDEGALPTAEDIRKVIAAAGSEAGPGAKDLEVTQLADTPDGRYRVFEFKTGSVKTTGDDQALGVEVVRPIQRTLSRSDVVSVAEAFPRIDTIGPAVAKNLTSKAMAAILLSSLAMILYITVRFEFRFGLGAVAALVHDVVITLGFLATLDWVDAQIGIDLGTKIDLPIVAAILTILGYSVNDTIVIFDRIRENLKGKKPGQDMAEIVNTSINQTLSRTVLTSTTTLLTTVVLFLSTFLGGGLEVIRGFALALSFGVVLGTYSSMFVAAPALLADRDRLYRILMIEAGVLFGVWVLFGVVRNLM